MEKDKDIEQIKKQLIQAQKDRANGVKYYTVEELDVSLKEHLSK